MESGSTKPESELYRFNWQPETGNLMYCMPEKDTVVSLYVGGVDDDKGGIFSTDKSITIQADGKIKMIGKTVNAEAEKELEVLNGTTNVQIKNRINIKGTMSFLGYGATAPERQEKADKMNTSKLRLPDKYESELERMSQEIMEGYFRKDGGKLSPEDRASMAKTLIMVHEMADVQERKNNLPPEKGEFIGDSQSMYYDKAGNKYGIIYAWKMMTQFRTQGR
ncbi:MAG: hypothetical protein HDT39_07320 [Lachnospiraceae bacterium]|nr:hypothetical protein [Lachnospiraceae bacterium]